MKDEANTLKSLQLLTKYNIIGIPTSAAPPAYTIKSALQITDENSSGGSQKITTDEITQIANQFL
jgi:hypothetical protein